MIGDGIFLAGAALMTAGVWQWSQPAAFVFAGLMLVAFSFLAFGGDSNGDRQ